MARPVDLTDPNGKHPCLRPRDLDLFGLKPDLRAYQPIRVFHFHLVKAWTPKSDPLFAGPERSACEEGLSLDFRSSGLARNVEND